MSDYTFSQAEDLIVSQRRIIESLREASDNKDLLIEALKARLKKLEDG